jgi:hypothetical protein
MAIMPEHDSAAGRVRAGSDEVAAPHGSLTIVPPGDSTVTIEADGLFIRVFTSLATDLLPLCSNNDHYAQPDVRVAPMVPFPDPVDGFKLRSYPFSDNPAVWYPGGAYEPTREEDTRYGRYFRSTNIMLHFQNRVAPRDESHTFPHSTPDFEHGAIQLYGERLHHVRTPWGPDTKEWREDEHVTLGSPGFLVFPPQLVHTTQTLSPTSGSIDIYCPPRAEVPKPSKVITADIYPVPENAKDSLPTANFGGSGH